jgi:hypothetical protein
MLSAGFTNSTMVERAQEGVIDEHAQAQNLAEGGDTFGFARVC